MAAMQSRGPTTPPPPPVIGKAGRYTIFITPPPTPRPPPEKKPLSQSPITPGHVAGPLNAASLPEKSAAPEVAPPVQVPPPHFKKQASKGPSLFGFLWDAVARVQNAHSSLDEYLAEWLGLNQSKYQWALDDYYEKNTGSSKECGKPKDQVIKDQTV